MPSHRSSLTRILSFLLLAGPLLTLPLVTGGCGAGIVGTFLASDKNKTSTPAPPPTLVTLQEAEGPLVPAENLFITIAIENRLMPLTADVKVELRALGVVAKQASAFLQFGDAHSTRVTFIFRTQEIQEEVIRLVGDPTLKSVALTAADVPATLAVLVDGVDAAPPVPFLLRRQPIAELEVPAGSLERAVVSTLGTEVLRLRLKSLKLRPSEGGDPIAVNKLSMLVGTQVGKAKDGSPLLSIQPATGLSLTPDPASGDTILSGVVPPSGITAQALIRVSSLLSGNSTVEGRVYYRPEIFVALPARGATEGETVVALTGKGLVPLDHTGAVSKFDFSSITLKIQKGGRETELPSSALRTLESNGDRLVFAMPPSPDGFSGPADMVLEAVLTSNVEGRVPVQAKAGGVFTYGGSMPYFGTRGALLRNAATRTVFGHLTDPASLTRDAMELFSGAGGLPMVTVLSARGNGLFTRFGQDFSAGSTLNLLQRNPADICLGSFALEAGPAALILNAGGAGGAQHSMLISRGLTNPLLAYHDPGISGPQASTRCVAGDLNKDGLDDFIILPGGAARTDAPTKYLAEPSNSGAGVAIFKPESLSNFSGPYGFEQMELADLDEDGHPDVLLAEGGKSPRLLVAYGDIDARYDKSQVWDVSLVIPGYTPDAGSRVIGVHACGPEQSRSVVLTFSGVSGSMTTPPTVVVLQPGTVSRTWKQPTAADVLRYPGGSKQTLAKTVAGDLDGDSIPELVVAVVDDPTTSLALLAWNSTARNFSLLANGVDLGTEPIVSVRNLQIGVAVAAGTHGQQADLPGVFVNHEFAASGTTEHHLSTLVVDRESPTLRLIAPYAARELPQEIQGLTMGHYRQASPFWEGELDAYLAAKDSLILLSNDGIGGFSLSQTTLAAPLILPSTLTNLSLGASASAKPREAPAFLTEDGKLGLVLPDDPETVLYAKVGAAPKDLRDYAAAPPHQTPVRPESRLLCDDVDRDGIRDLVVLLNLSTIQANGKESESLLLFFRGDPMAKPEDFPYLMPTVVAGKGSTTHGNASCIALGDFAPGGQGYLELAVAVPRGHSTQPAEGNHIRFYRFLATPSQTGGGHFRLSYTSPTNSALISGENPERLVARDFNGDGRTDLAVASSGDSGLRVFHNMSLPSTASTVEVDISSFVGAAANPRSLPSGFPHTLESQDINGDGLPDIVVAVREVGSPQQEVVAHYLSPGISPTLPMGLVPHLRTGNHVLQNGLPVPRDGALSLGLGDLNGDRVPDLLIGWNSKGTGDKNLRVLFGNDL